MKRRDFLRYGSTAALMTTFPGLSIAMPDKANQRPLGLQLYTVMEMLDADFEGTIKTVSELGYAEVETLGDFDKDPAWLKKLFSQYGLTSPSQHLMPRGLGKIFAAGFRKEIPFDELKQAFLKAFSFDCIDDLIHECAGMAQGIGQEYLTWQITWDVQMQSKAAVNELVRTLNKAGEICKQKGLKLAYHNHGAEFVEVDGIIPYDQIIEGTDPNLMDMEMDLAWVTHAGADPLTYLQKYPGRFRLCHLKDVAEDGSVRGSGKGVVDFKRFLDAAGPAGVKHYFVEYDAPEDPAAVIKESYTYLRPML